MKWTNCIIIIDIDECSEEHDCGQFAYCTDTDGSYYCNCTTGYHGDGKTCVSMLLIK